MPAIVPISGLASPLSMTPATGASATSTSASGGSSSFGQVLSDALEQVDQLQQSADTASTQLASGQSTDLHSALMTVEEASLAMQLTVQVRNKVADAYQEIMRMTV